jgi:hypothetical protein
MLVCGSRERAISVHDITLSRVHILYNPSIILQFSWKIQTNPEFLVACNIAKLKEYVSERVPPSQPADTLLTGTFDMHGNHMLSICARYGDKWTNGKMNYDMLMGLKPEEGSILEFP